jgi:fumarylacetoacetate (FAA) hydrolase family protein
VHEQEVELAIGDVMQIGDHTVTVIDIDDSEVSLRVDVMGHEEFALNHSHLAARPYK